MMRIILSIYILLLSFSGMANESSSRIYKDLQKAHSLKRVLYVAAHPDDENTRALAWLSLGENAETAYLSLTRGDGGQNLIGEELGADLGVLRTQELLAARSHDGAKQFFSRAVDFGYSKSAKETFEKWGKELMLADVVMVIRKFKPEVIITRFPPDKRGGHGHHTASAILAIEAFSKAADPTYMPEQVKEFGVWQAKSVYWNASSWWNKEIAAQAKDNENYLVADIGGYDPLLGMSYNEIGTIARSQHKCQGFGAIVERGSRLEYFEHMAGTKLKSDFFEEVDKSWTKLVDANFDKNFKSLLNNFNFANPVASVPLLFQIKKGLEKLPASYFKEEKIKRIDDIIINCLGLYIDLTGTDFSGLSGEVIELSLNLTNRSDLTVKVLEEQNWVTCEKNEEVLIKTIANPAINFSNPYWLEKPFVNLFTVVNPRDLAAPISRPSIEKTIQLKIGENTMAYTVPAIYKWRDPSYGERSRELIVTPNFAVNFEESNAVLKPNETKEVKLKVQSFKKDLADEIVITAPKGWTVSPTKINIEIAKKNAEQWVTFKLTPNAQAVKGDLTLSNKNGQPLQYYTEIKYDHIPTQAIFRQAVLACVPLDAKIIPGKVAYINGVKGDVPKAIQQLGFIVEEFEVSDLAKVDFSGFETVVLGIRIYNVYPELKNFDDKLFAYVKNGGNVVMQYNTASRRVKSESFGPFPFELSRDRVTDENASPTFLAKDHALLNSPNKITADDFKGWVQERGLYFATNWSEEYTPILAWNDVDEEPVSGGLIVANYGKGRFVYTGISFFRELPKGVSGAYKLFANLLSYQP
ncbi:LmbE family protein [Putridiphycobacter roseus]|uniref:LmbE family protein n=1 Tax=Putridiphycobacter roseus TaxID=2219161 RepID=A0A2W1N6J4_9FLAO|nr:PIG-L family deacetylase [Putridiphycobacter roseus]PZE18761.1 LmbE family protein [Putridiphycobacter roseus]